jgi:hypothetical protein
MEEILKQLLMQRSAETMANAAQDDAALQTQLAQTKNARATAATAHQPIILPKTGAIGMDESGAAIRAGQGPQGQSDFSESYDNADVAKHWGRGFVPHPDDLRGKSSFSDVPDIVQQSFQVNDRHRKDIDAAQTRALGDNLLRGTTGPGAWKYGLLPEDMVVERDVGQIQGTIETPLGRAQPGQAAVQRNPDVDGDEAFIRQLMAQLPMQRGY